MRVGIGVDVHAFAAGPTPDRQLWLGAYSCLFPDRKLRDSLILIPRGFRAFNASRGPGKMADPIVANAKGRCSNLASIRG